MQLRKLFFNNFEIFVIISLIMLLINLIFFYIFSRLRHLNSKYPDIKSKVYRIILEKTKRAHDRLGIPVFLSSGTCLGYFREGKFIDYDYDIDVGIYATDYTPKIINEMRKEGLLLYRVLGTPKDGMELSFKLPDTLIGDNAKIDIFLHYRDKDKDGKKTISWCAFESPDYKKKIRYRVSDFNLKEDDFVGMKIYVPHPTLKYIEEHYGYDWKTPKMPFTDYIYSSSPTSIVKE